MLNLHYYPLKHIQTLNKSETIGLYGLTESIHMYISVRHSP